MGCSLFVIVEQLQVIWLLNFSCFNKVLFLIIRLFEQVVDAYALIGDVSGLAEKIQSFFMQEVISETHSALKDIVQEVLLCN